MDPVTLPDCSKQRRERLLTPAQRRELIRVIATDGPEGLEAWLQKAEQEDPGIRQRVEAERRRLEQAARRERQRLTSHYDEARGEAEAQWEKERRELARKRQELGRKVDELMAEQAPDREALAERSSVLRATFQAAEEDPEAPSLWRRARTWLHRAWLWLVSLWVRFIRWITGQEARGPATATLELPEGTKLDLPTLLADSPELRAEVRERVSGQGWRAKVRDAWRRLTGRQDYAEVAREIMEEELAEATEAVNVEREQTAADMQDQIAQVEEARRRAMAKEKRELEQIEAEREARLEEIDAELEQGPYEAVADEVTQELSEAGLVDEKGRPTHALLERLGNLLYEEARRALPHGGHIQAGSFRGAQEAYEKQPMRSLNERGAMDLVSTVIRARQNHPKVRHIYDDDVLVNREIRADTTHVVIIFDRSGSMEAHGRFEAAKRLCLIMYQAVKDHDPSNRIDLLAMSTDVDQVGLDGAWNAELGGFTNQALAIKKAHRLLEAGGGERRLVYLITDGLPEAYPTPEGNRVAKPEDALPITARAAEQLGEMEGTRLVLLQLETEDELFLEAAQQVAQAADGRVVGVDPDELTQEVLMDFEAAAG